MPSHELAEGFGLTRRLLLSERSFAFRKLAGRYGYGERIRTFTRKREEAGTLLALRARTRSSLN
jgi:hypothetical protein